MTSFAIGDVHGNLRALDDVLAQLEPLLTARDTVIFLGDFIDRGPNSAQVCRSGFRTADAVRYRHRGR